MTPQEIKAECEARWNRCGVINPGNANIFHDGGKSLEIMEGVAAKTKNGRDADAFMKRIRKHYGPAPMFYIGSGNQAFKCPEWLVERYKASCPNNWRYLVANYGITEAKPKKEKELFGLISSEIDREPEAKQFAKQAKRRVTKRKVDAAAKILAKIPKDRMAEFMSRFGITLEVSAKIAANDNLTETAREFLKLALAA